MPVQIKSNVKDPDRIRARRAQIVQAAVRLFSEKGFHKTTTREIARESGLSNGALYEYVKSKEDVLFLVCQHIHREMLDSLRQSLSEYTTAALRLKHAILVFYAVIDRMKDDVLLIYQESKSLPHPHLREVLRQEQEITDIFGQLLREGVQDHSLRMSEALIPLIAHNIVVSGQMWAFRRWALQGVSFDQFAELQLRSILQSCGVDGNEI